MDLYFRAFSYPNGGVVNEFVGSIPSASANYTTEDQIVGFHGIARKNCIKRLGVYTQINSNELRGKHDRLIGTSDHC